MRFSGHETFICKQFWLKKGYDFLANGYRFNDNDAVVKLGVGKNMVSSIAYWMKSFGLCDDNWGVTSLANFIFDSKTGKDPYLEDIGTIWLLNYHLIKENYASIYNIFFNEFRRGRFEFTTEQLQRFVETIAKENNAFNANTVKSDISVFHRMYPVTDHENINGELEDIHASIFHELQLITRTREEDLEKLRYYLYHLENDLRDNLPSSIVLYSILDNYKDQLTISFNELEVGNNSPGVIFALNKEGLYAKIEGITKKYKEVVFSNNSGVQVLQFKTPIDKWVVLGEYYG